MVNPAPVRVPRKSTMSSPLVQAANKIVTSPTFAKARSIDFDKKNEYDKFIKFIESSNKELLKIKLPNKDQVVKAGGLGDGGGGGGILPELLSALAGLVSGAVIKPLARTIRNLIPKRFRARLRKLRMDILRPFRRFKSFIKSLPGKIKAKLGKYADEAVKILKKYTDDAVVAIKNLKNAKWIKTLISQSRKVTTLVDDGFKLGKNFIMNSKILKTSQAIVNKAAPKLTSMGIGELTIIGGVATDLTMGAWRLKEGDNTGAALSFIGAIPLIGIPFNLVDIGRDVGLFEEDGALDWLDFLDWFRLNKDNPNYVDKRNEAEIKTDEDFDTYLRETYEKNLNEQLEKLKGVKGKEATRKRMSIINQLKDLPDLTSDQLKSKINKGIGKVEIGDIKFFGKNKSSYNEIRKFLDNIESSKINTNNSVSTTIINNPNQYLIPFNTTAGSTENLSGSFNFNVNTSIVDFNYGEFNSLFTDELFQLKLDK